MPKVKKNNFCIGKSVLEGFVNPIPGLQKLYGWYLQKHLQTSYDHLKGQMYSMGIDKTSYKHLKIKITIQLP